MRSRRCGAHDAADRANARMRFTTAGADCIVPRRREAQITYIAGSWKVEAGGTDYPELVQPIPDCHPRNASGDREARLQSAPALAPRLTKWDKSSPRSSPRWRA